MEPTQPVPPPTVRPGLAEMARVFLLIGTFAFGGQSGLLALLNRDLVERRQWLTETDIAEAFTYVQLLPGAVVVQVVAFLGWRLRGARGVAVATVAFLLPSVVVMLLLGIVYHRLVTLVSVRAALAGLTAAVVGLIAVATWKQGRKILTGPLPFAIAVLACAAALLWQVNPAAVVIVAGVLGLLREATAGSKTQEGTS